MDARETMYQVLTGANAVLNWISDNFTDAELLRFVLALVGLRVLSLLAGG
ncbi:MAG: hypothetical protein ACK53K_03535 [Burkholderiales bacterium]|jgi:hypothetical protein